MKISVIIPNYNGADLLAKNLPKVIEELKRYPEHLLEIIISDDGSTDKSRETIENIIKRYAGQVKIRQINNKHQGFSTTVNEGVKIAEGELIILLNTDVYPKENFLNPLLSQFQDKNIFAVGMMDESIENTNIVRRGRGEGYWHKGFVLHKRGEINKTDTFWVAGGSGIFRKSVWLKLSGFSQIYNPFYWEDIDLSYRAQKSGYKIVFEPESVVVHEHAIGAIKKTTSPFTIKLVSYRNQFIFIWKNITDTDLLISHFLWLPIHFLQQLLKGDFAFHLGFFKAVLLIGQTIKERKRSKELFRISDKVLLKIR